MVLLLDAATQAFVLIEADGRIVSFNPAAEALFGWTREEAAGADAGELLLAQSGRAELRAELHRFGDGRHRTADPTPPSSSRRSIAAGMSFRSNCACR